MSIVLLGVLLGGNFGFDSPPDQPPHLSEMGRYSGPKEKGGKATRVVWGGVSDVPEGLLTDSDLTGGILDLSRCSLPGAG